MYQIQVRRYNSEVWRDWRRPWLTRQAAEIAMAEVIQSDEQSDWCGVYVYQIVEV